MIQTGTGDTGGNREIQEDRGGKQGDLARRIQAKTGDTRGNRGIQRNTG